MSLTREEVLKVAKLARLEFREEEIEEFRQQLNDILGYVEVLNEVDVEGVEPLISVHDGEGRLRIDEIKKSLSAEEAMRNAPETDNGALIVPKVVGE